MQIHSTKGILTKKHVHLHMATHYQYFEHVIRIENAYNRLQKIHVAVTRWTKIIITDMRKLTGSLTFKIQSSGV